MHDHEHGDHDHPRVGGGALRVGIGGPVGSGKTQALVAALCRTLRDRLSIGVVTNDIYTTEDADFLRRHAILPDERIRAVETGCCPHTAIRDDIAANQEAIDELERQLAPLDLVLLESGGDNLTAIFSRALVDRQIFVIDVAGGDKVPRKGGPGVTTADLLVINKTDLAALVGADLDVMRRDAERVRGGRPTLLLSLTEDPSADAVAEWIREQRAVDRTVDDVKAHARLVVDCDARGESVVRELRSDAPIVLCRSRDAVYLVGGAAGPLGGDDLRLDVIVASGARLAIRSAAASVALPGRDGTRSRFEVDAEVGPEAVLDWAPGPVVATARSGHDMRARVVAHPQARVRWREELVAGRSGEKAGSLTARLVIDRGGQPVLRQELRIGADAPAWDGPAVLDGARAVGSYVFLGGAGPASPPHDGAARTRVLALAGCGFLVTSLGLPAAVRAALDVVSSPVHAAGS